MSFQTINTREWHDKYFEAETGSEQDRIDTAATDDAYAAVRRILIENGLPIAYNDLAEELVAVIYRYIVKSREQQAA